MWANRDCKVPPNYNRGNRRFTCVYGVGALHAERTTVCRHSVETIARAPGRNGKLGVRTCRTDTQRGTGYYTTVVITRMRVRVRLCRRTRIITRYEEIRSSRPGRNGLSEKRLRNKVKAIKTRTRRRNAREIMY